MPSEVEESLVDKLGARIDSTIDEYDASENHAMFAIGIQDADTEDDPDAQVQVYCATAGYYSLLTKGLMYELCDQIESGDMSLFIALREAIRQVEEEFEFSPDEDLLPDTTSHTIH